MSRTCAPVAGTYFALCARAALVECGRRAPQSLTEGGRLRRDLGSEAEDESPKLRGRRSEGLRLPNAASSVWMLICGAGSLSTAWRIVGQSPLSRHQTRSTPRYTTVAGRTRWHSGSGMPPRVHQEGFTLVKRTPSVPPVTAPVLHSLVYFIQLSSLSYQHCDGRSPLQPLHRTWSDVGIGSSRKRISTW